MGLWGAAQRCASTPTRRSSWFGRGMLPSRRGTTSSRRRVVRSWWCRRRASQVRQLWHRTGPAHRHPHQPAHDHRIARRRGNWVTETEGLVKLGLQLNSFDWNGGSERFAGTLAKIARAAEEAGFDRIGVFDHVWQHPIMGGPDANEPECYTTLAFLAANTGRAKLTAMVTGVHFRHPAVLVKTVTTLDILSGGRAWLGIGSGHYEEEARGLGIPFPPQRERFEMLEEAVQICLKMWSGERGDERPFEGKHYKLERPLNLPQSLTRPHPPIMIAGDGERKTLRLVARYADACSLRPGPEIPEKLDILRRHCEAEGRNYDSIEKTCAFAFDVGEDGQKVGQLLGQLRWLGGMGVETVIGAVPKVDRITSLEVLGREVIPAVANF